jgi:hypothetical protein
LLTKTLEMNEYFQKTNSMTSRLVHRGITDEKVKNAVRLYVYSIMSEHVREAERVCTKDPYILKHMTYLNALFPNAKFVYMVRDPRAQVASNLKLEFFSYEFSCILFFFSQKTAI